MNIDFDEGESGFWEARILHGLARHAAVRGERLEDRELIGFLLEATNAHMARSEFDELRERVGTEAEEWPAWTAMAQFWRRTVGPSRLEEDLSEQRSAALERAERAERSAFEALAETSRVARDRDQARAEVKRLEAELERLKAGASASR